MVNLVRHKMSNKNSQVFLLDFIISIILVITIIGFIVSFKFISYENFDVYSVNLNILNSFYNTKVNSLNEGFFVELFRSGLIRNIDYNIPQLIGYFYKQNEIDIAKNLTEDFIKDFVPKNVNIDIKLIDNLVIINLFNKTVTNVNFENSTTSFMTSRIIIGQYNSTDYFGPYTLVIRTWQ